MNKGVKIRHRRLHAFHESKVLNVLMIVLIMMLEWMNCTGLSLIPGLCGLIALLFFIGYSLWLWFKKPAEIPINPGLSNFNGYFILYFLITSVMKDTNEWWFIFPILAGMVTLCIYLVRNDDVKYKI